MIVYPAVVVHGLADAVAVLAERRPATLLSAPAAALSGGCLWWRSLIAQAGAIHPDTPFHDVLDCADAPGRAMAALRVGQRRLILMPDCPAYAAVCAAAAAMDAIVSPQRPISLDLATRGARRRLPAWLAAVTSPP